MDNHTLDLFGGKVCGKCKFWKMFCEFYICRRSLDGTGGYCRGCAKQVSKDRFYKNQQRCNQQAREWKLKNSDKVADYSLNRSQRAAENKAKSIETLSEIQVRRLSPLIGLEEERAYRDKTRDRIRVRGNHNKRRAYKLNPAMCTAIQEMRRTAKNSGTFTFQEWQSLCDKYSWKCLACGENRKLTIDHVIPLSRGGSNLIDNIQPLCQSCNSKKNTNTIDYRR